MLKYSFYNDYSEGCHPAVLQALQDNNSTQESGYGLDKYSLEATELVKGKLGRLDVDVHFVSGGTQANLLVIAAMLKPYQSIISANSGHINVHEAGAIEATGHKINACESKDGKLIVDQISKVLADNPFEHTVKPKAVFISNATEVGTIYKESEVKAHSEFCKENNLYLYMDGARLGSALMAEGSDLDLGKVASYVDAFYIGGTKNGALLGEAIVIVNPELKEDFRYHMKQRGALLAKGRVLAAQFNALFQGELYFELAKHANNMATKLATGIKELGYDFHSESVTNQIFPIFANDAIKKLNELYGFYTWEKIDDQKSAVRLVTSWATKPENVEQFISDLANLTKQTVN